MDDVDIRLTKELLIKSIKLRINQNNFNVIENSVLRTNDPFLTYLFAKEIKGADINKHLQVVLNSDDYQTLYTFAMEIDCDKTQIQNKIINHGEAKWIYYLFWADNIDFKLLEEALYKTNDIDYIFKFGLSFKEANKDKIIDLIIKSKNIKYISQLGKFGVGFFERERIISEIQEENIRKLKK